MHQVIRKKGLGVSTQLDWPRPRRNPLHHHQVIKSARETFKDTAAEEAAIAEAAAEE